MHNAKALPFALLLSTPLVAPAHAQEADRATLPAVNVVGAQDDGYTTPDATSGTKTNAPLRDVPQTINVVPARVLEDQHVNSMQDALKNVPGVSFSHGDGQRDQVSIRGFSAIADQYVDGFRDDALYFRDLSNIERVDVIKGPAAVLYGRGSAGGLINRISKKPGKDITAANLSLGSWKDRRLEADLGRANGDQSLSWRLTGAIEKADNYRHQQFLDRKAIAPSAQIRFSPDTQVLLQAEYLNDRRVTDFGIPAYQGRPVNVDPGTYYGAANARVRHRQIAQNNTCRNGNHRAVADPEDKQREEDKGNCSGQSRDCAEQHGEDARARAERSADQHVRRRVSPHEHRTCGGGEDESRADRHKDEPRRLRREFTDILQVETEHDKEGDNGGVQAYIEKNSDHIATITKESKRISEMLLVCLVCSF